MRCGLGIGRRGTTLALVLVAAMSTGCVDDLPEQWQLEDHRLLAARWNPNDASDRAWVRPGELGAMEFFFVDPPRRPTEGTWGLVFCDGTVAPTGEAFCLTDEVDLRLETTPQSTVPPFAIDVPPDPRGTDLVALGVFCSGPDGDTIPVPAIQADELVERCEPTIGDINRFQFAVPYEQGGETNVRPSFERAVVSIDGVLDFWPAASSEPECEGPTPTRPVIRAASPPVDLVVVADAADREALPEDGGLEDLTFGHVASAGTLDRFFSVIDDRTPEVRVEWEPPASVPPGGLVRFAFVVTDGRAGTDWIVRELCIAP